MISSGRQLCFSKVISHFLNKCGRDVKVILTAAAQYVYCIYTALNAKKGKNEGSGKNNDHGTMTDTGGHKLLTLLAASLEKIFHCINKILHELYMTA